MFDDHPQAGGMTCVIVRHDSFCPMAHGEGTQCAVGCKPTSSVVDKATLLKTMQRDFRNRAQRRADAKNKGGAN